MSDATRPNGKQTMERLPDMLLKAHDEVCAVLKSLRDSRDLLQKSSVNQLRQTSAKLQEVTDATELAATGILDGLDRSIGMVDQLEGLDASGNVEAAAIRGQLRDELWQAQAALQFQDITAQQLSYAASLLAELEDRMQGLATALEADGFAEVTSDSAARALAAAKAFDPNATMANATGRQALADSIFATPG
jgi:chemotaxis regulatin CheY-phosphate phosphatase CheZ